MEDMINKTENMELVATATDGGALIHAVKEHQPDLAIVDVKMTPMDGLEAIEQLKKTGTNTKFMLLTSHDTEGFIEHALTLNVDGYVLKDDLKYSNFSTIVSNIHLGFKYFSPIISEKI